MHKVETVGEVYMAVSGCPTRVVNHAELAAFLALDMIHAMHDVRSYIGTAMPDIDAALLKTDDLSTPTIDIHIGLNSGRINAGVVGTNNPRFKLFGDTVNTASRMESTCPVGKIQISRTTHHFLNGKFKTTCRGKIKVKGKGELTTYFLDGFCDGGDDGKDGGGKDTAAVGEKEAGTSYTLRRTASEYSPMLTPRIKAKLCAWAQHAKKEKKKEKMRWHSTSQDRRHTADGGPTKIERYSLRQAALRIMSQRAEIAPDAKSDNNDPVVSSLGVGIDVTKRRKSLSEHESDIRLKTGDSARIIRAFSLKDDSSYRSTTAVESGLLACEHLISGESSRDLRNASSMSFVDVLTTAQARQSSLNRVLADDSKHDDNDGEDRERQRPPRSSTSDIRRGTISQRHADPIIALNGMPSQSPTPKHSPGVNSSKDHSSDLFYETSSPSVTLVRTDDADLSVRRRNSMQTGELRSSRRRFYKLIRCISKSEFRAVDFDILQMYSSAFWEHLKVKYHHQTILSMIIACIIVALLTFYDYFQYLNHQVKDDCLHNLVVFFASSACNSNSPALRSFFFSLSFSFFSFQNKIDQSKLNENNHSFESQTGRDKFVAKVFEKALVRTSVIIVISLIYVLSTLTFKRIYLRWLHLVFFSFGLLFLYLSFETGCDADVIYLEMFVCALLSTNVFRVFPRILTMCVMSFSFFAVSQTLHGGRMAMASTVDFLVLFLSLGLQSFPLLSQQHYERVNFANARELSKSSKQRAKESKHLRKLLLKLLPAQVIDEIFAGREVVADPYDDVTILFTDMKGFTAFSSRIQPSELVDFLNTMYSAFDEILDKFGLYKVEVIGDAYYVVSGCPKPRTPEKSVINCIEAALAMLRTLPRVCADPTVQIRVGIHSGDVVAGVVGVKDPRYHLFGPNVTKAMQMESHGIPGKVHISKASVDRLKPGASRDAYAIQSRGVDAAVPWSEETFIVAGKRKSRSGKF